MAMGATRRLRLILLTQGLWASTVYRVSHHMYYAVNVPFLRSAVRFCCQLARKRVEIVTGISLPPECFIGEGLYIGHFGTLIVAPKATIGSHCNLSQGMTIGYGGRGANGGFPTIGNRVYIAANAVVVGNITIADDVVIGAGAVVTRSVPPRAVMVGNPARVSSYKGSFDFIAYDGMHQDVERLAALAALEEEQRSTGDAAPPAEDATKERETILKR